MEYCEASSAYMVKFHEVDKKLNVFGYIYIYIYIYIYVCMYLIRQQNILTVELTKIHHIFIYISIFSQAKKKTKKN